jgi:hypothetical protein
MKWAMPRLTIRRLMLMVTGIAVIFGFAAWMIRMTGRSNRFGQLANQHAQEYYLHRAHIDTYPTLAAPLEKAGMSPAAAEKFLGGTVWRPRPCDYHWTMKAKYERLAQYPWLSAGPDPPEPE